MLAHVKARIKEAAETGRFEVTHPLHGYKEWPDFEKQKALWRALEAEGWEVKHHDNPDPGDPRSHAYTSIHW